MTAAAAPSDHAGPETGGAGPPAHVAIIMDGNGRWAKSRGLPRSVGHERGVEALRRTVEAAGELGLEHLTVFSFSTENWRRPAEEVSALFGLLRSYVRRDLKRLKADGVRIRVLGSREGLPSDVLALVEQAEAETLGNSKFGLNIAFNYGAREEIARAARKACADIEAGKLAPEALTADVLDTYLDTADIPDPDLVIRTSGEYRISNFLLWQIAYAEFVFQDVLWPDFGRSHLEAALETFRNRERRYGGVGGS